MQARQKILDAHVAEAGELQLAWMRIATGSTASDLAAMAPQRQRVQYLKVEVVVLYVLHPRSPAPAASHLPYSASVELPQLWVGLSGQLQEVRCSAAGGQVRRQRGRWWVAVVLAVAVREEEADWSSNPDVAKLSAQAVPSPAPLTEAVWR